MLEIKSRLHINVELHVACPAEVVMSGGPTGSSTRTPRVSQLEVHYSPHAQKKEKKKTDDNDDDNDSDDDDDVEHRAM